MAVEKRLYWLRHLILIVVTAIVLFPMMWLISTSIRRDQAAFSPKLFSNRVTLQYYRNLLFPERSVGRLILDIQSAVYLTGDYRDKSHSDIDKTVERYLNKYDSLMAETEDLVSKIDSGFDEIKEFMDSEGTGRMIESMDAIRLKDSEAIDERLEKLSVDRESDLYRAAIGEVFQGVEPGQDLSYLFLLDKLGDTGAPVKLALEKYMEEYEKLLLNNSELEGMVSQIEFEEKDQVLESLAKTPDYISGEAIEYSDWRKTEWLRIINKSLKGLEGSDEIEKIKVTKDKLYDTFKGANSLWKEFTEANDELKDRLAMVKAGVMGEVVSQYETAVSRIEEIDNAIETETAAIKKNETAKETILSSFEIATAVIVPETEKLRSLKSVVGQITEEVSIESVPENGFSEIVEVVGNISDRLQLIEEALGNIGYVENEYYSIITSLKKELAWFFAEKDKMLAMTSNKDVERAFEILQTTGINLMRVIPSLFAVVEDFVSLENTISNSRTDIENLNAEKDSLNAFILENRETVESKTKELEETIETATLEMVSVYMEEKFVSVVDIKNYVEKAGPVVVEQLDSKLKTRYRDYYWYEDFRTAYLNAVEGSKNINDALVEMRAYGESLKGKIYEYIALRFLGTPVTLDEFSGMQETYNTAFQLFNARYQRASRLISDLIDNSVSYARDQENDLRNIDKAIFRTEQVWRQKESTYFRFVGWLGNSIFVALMVSLISVVVTAMAAYPFSRMRFPGRKQGLLTLLLVQMFPSIMFMIALYALLQFIGNYIPMLGLNSIGGLIFAYSGQIAFNIFLIKGYFDTIPDSLEESAMIDGATRFQAFRRVVIPLSRPILAVVAILTFMNIFNEFLIARILLQDIDKWTYAVGLWQFSGRFETSWGPFTAAALIGAVPMVIFFLVLQDYIVGGLTKGAVKG